jgi:hypothetical protein
MNVHTILSIALAGMVCGFFASTASAQGKPKATVENTDPCALVTKDEIQAAIEAKRDPNQLASLKQKGIAWSITTTSTTVGEARLCQIHWQGNLGGAMHETGDMTVSVFKAEYFNSQVSDSNRSRRNKGRPELTSVPGVGDEAYFFGYSDKGNPEARVGDVAVGVEFLAGKPSVDLLRAAVSRVR